MPGMLPLGGQEGVARVWKFQRVPRSAMWRNKGVVKTRHQFDAHPTPDDMLDLLEEALTRGVERPSSYSDLFHSVYRTPKVSGPVSRAVGMFDVAGGWQEMTMRGRYPGLWRKYDLRSAYLWSASEGLPEPKSFRYSERFGSKDGLYLCDLDPNPTAPYPYRNGGRLPVTVEEVETYGLTVRRIWHGITWNRPQQIEPLIQSITSWSCAKQVGRGFWGRWASKAAVTCATYTPNRELSKEWDMPTYTYNPIWAHLVVSRVRLKVYRAAMAGPTARVYVDSVITQADLGADLGRAGDWKLEEVFTGLDIRHINVYRSAA